jgi:hypothetical protein
MDARTGATHFDTFHAMAVIFMIGNRTFDRIKEAGPARTTVELGVGAENGCTGNGINKSTGAFFI